MLQCGSDDLIDGDDQDEMELATENKSNLP